MTDQLDFDGWFNTTLRSLDGLLAFFRFLRFAGHDAILSTRYSQTSNATQRLIHRRNPELNPNSGAMSISAPRESGNDRHAEDF